MNQVLLATVIVLLVIIILRMPREEHHTHSTPPPAGFLGQKKAASHPLVPRRKKPAPVPRGGRPREATADHTPHFRRGEHFPEMSVLEERHMGPDSLIDMAYAGSDTNSIYDEFTTQNM